ncbi:sporulation protein [Staphylococcus sp. ACRSN]|uniref:sporulation protein n=1 Tax=Staphylococcus sp. ACRSN TaxID=2918214 RepID=UPI001EF3429F|nr:sporulation protein [Staphylococcus sp. ACRSN]MCG7340406.1 sporulation protein [Staphylococcus sp. ACRSN]
MFEKLLSSFGVNNLKVDTKVKGDKIKINGKLSGTIYIKGGATEEVIDKIELKLIEKIKNDDATSDFKILENVVDQFEIKELIKVSEKENLNKSFTFNVSYEDLKQKPKTLTLKTHVYLASSIDNYDEDELKIIYH